MVVAPFEILRMRSLPVSAIKRSPAESTATPRGFANQSVATVVITPFETSRTRLLTVSAMYRLPAESTATPVGPFNWALVAGPLSPSTLPPPATVVITPFETLRMRELPSSAMYTLPAESTETPVGPFNWAPVAGPLSPSTLPPPATVVITPFEILRMRLLLVSAIYRLPAESRTTPEGPYNWAPVAGPLSPL